MLFSDAKPTLTDKLASVHSVRGGDALIAAATRFFKATVTAIFRRQRRFFPFDTCKWTFIDVLLHVSSCGCFRMRGAEQQQHQRQQ
jgi:hypothetical protein